VASRKRASVHDAAGIKTRSFTPTAKKKELEKAEEIADASLK